MVGWRKLSLAFTAIGASVLTNLKGTLDSRDLALVLISIVSTFVVGNSIENHAKKIKKVKDEL